MTTLKQVFEQYASFGAGSAATGTPELDSAKFTKLCKETKLISKSLTTTDADLIFTRVKAKGQRKIGFAEFRSALEEVAKKTGQDVSAVEAKVTRAGGPQSSGTQADSGGVLDRMTDTSQYTGSHKERFDSEGHGKGLAGRDSTAKGTGHIPAARGAAGGDLASHLDRTAADVRGVKKATPGTTATQHRPAASSAKQPAAAKASTKTGSTPVKSTGQPGSSSASSGAGGSLKQVFEQYASFGAGSAATGTPELDSAKFTKLCKETKLISKSLTTTDADLIFTRVKAKGQRKIGFAEFRSALEEVAKKTGQDVSAVEAKVTRAGGPQSSGTQADSGGVLDRMTDTSQYTGSHKERFDSEGHGKGLAGRDSTAKGTGHIPAVGGGSDLASHLDRSPANVRGVKK